MMSRFCNKYFKVSETDQKSGHAVAKPGTKLLNHYSVQKQDYPGVINQPA